MGLLNDILTTVSRNWLVVWAKIAGSTWIYRYSYHMTQISHHFEAGDGRIYKSLELVVNLHPSNLYNSPANKASFMAY